MAYLDEDMVVIIERFLSAASYGADGDVYATILYDISEIPDTDNIIAVKPEYIDLKVSDIVSKDQLKDCIYEDIRLPFKFDDLKNKPADKYIRNILLELGVILDFGGYTVSVYAYDEEFIVISPCTDMSIDELYKFRQFMNKLKSKGRIPDNAEICPFGHSKILIEGCMII